MLKKYGLILFLGSLGTYAVTKFASYLVSNGFYWLRIGTADGWIQFFGTIIGALVTILTVLDAMKKDQDKELDNTAKINMPYLYLSPHYDDSSKHIFGERSILYKDLDQGAFPIYFSFKNLTDKPAKLLNLIDNSFYIYSNETETYDLYDNYNTPIRFQGFIPSFNYNLFIQPNEENFNKFNFNFSIWDLIYLNETRRFKIDMVFIYRDIIDLVSYRHTYTFEFTGDVTAQKDLLISFTSENNTIEKEYINSTEFHKDEN